MYQVYKKMGSTNLALINFSWAMDLDPKGLNNHIKESIEKLFNAEEEDSLARLSESGIELQTVLMLLLLLLLLLHDDDDVP